MFRVVFKDCDQSFDRWTDALDAGNQLKPQCRSLLHDIRISENGKVIWVYSRSHVHPMYMGPGTYDRLVKLFVKENTESESDEIV
jgi:hypothetical protein